MPGRPSIAKLFFACAIGGILALTSPSSAQTVNYAYSSPEIQNIQQDLLYIVLTGDTTFDTCFVKAVRDKWTLSATTQTIYSYELENIILNNEHAYYIAPVVIRPAATAESYYVNIASPVQNRFADRIAIFNGKQRKITEYTPELFIASCYLLFNNPAGVHCGLEYAVNCLNQMVSTTLSGQLSNTAPAALKAAVCSNAGRLSTRTLLISKEIVGLKLKERVLSVYGYAYRVLPQAEIIDLMNSGSDQYCFLSESLMRSDVIHVFDLASKQLIYLARGLGLLTAREKDITDLNSCINGNCN